MLKLERRKKDGRYSSQGRGNHYYGDDEEAYRYTISEIEDFYKDGPKQFIDKGHGITEESIKFFKRKRGKLGQILQINIDQHREFDMEIRCTAGTVLLSGVTCGYGGTGPHGTLRILELIGLDSEEYKQKVFTNKHVNIDLRERGTAGRVYY
ncbi:uncharacterized protein METZ01_LOCUS114654 [marine metagenome]|uniref:Uncharacterized protein n=1 Tax=marine metagenome TaxID=408172 RepID=A0A381XB27_9ZZZZ|tara:strand:+ start:1220 stop:1675 length:456 start_codon:yes stop_codon:yes gene_type:complete